MIVGLLLEKQKTIEEVKNLFEQFPRWSGDWDVVIEDEHYVVYNTYLMNNVIHLIQTLNY